MERTLDDYDIQPLDDDELRSLPVFPLPRVVFFPGTTLPLLLFEPRYRRMIEDCLSRGPMAMGIVLASRWEGGASLLPVAGAGRIVGHERNENGTYNVILHGVCRVRLDPIAGSDTPYARAVAERLVDTVDTVPVEDTTALFSCASAVTAVVQREHEDFSLGVAPDDPPSRLADLVADRLVADPDKRQAILEELDVGRRVRLVTDAVGELMALLSAERHGRSKALD